MTSTMLPDVPTSTEVLIIGGGPAGALLSCLLSRRGIDNVLVEKQNDLARSFRGETIAAPSVQTLHALGFGPGLAEHGYLQTSSVVTVLEGKPVLTVDYRRFGDGTLPIDIPQPAMIDLFNRGAADAGHATYLAGWAMTGLSIDAENQVTGASVKSGDDRVAITARVVIGADGRFSKVRKASGLEAMIQPMERDFLSFLLPRPAGWGDRAELVVQGDKHLVILPTFPDQLRIGHNLTKRGLGELRSKGFEAFQRSIIEMDPRLAELVGSHLTGWDDCGFLEIFTAELPQWTRDGLVLIGDASHTATPILGQGVNLALQDVVTIAPILAAALAGGDGPLPASIFDAYVASRRKHKKFVTKFQRMQERQLAVGDRRGMRVRRWRYRALDATPLKYKLFNRVINARHHIDEVDLRLAAEAQAAARPLAVTAAQPA
jgi:2-polyprenyl-6-methoxyphenol hydroxylase-like FAD-dependent oxidoreductase